MPGNLLQIILLTLKFWEITIDAADIKIGLREKTTFWSLFEPLKMDLGVYHLTIDYIFIIKLFER